MRNVLILGAASDIAEAIAYKYAENGDAVFLAARNSNKLDRVCKDLEIRFGKSVSYHEFDAQNFDSHRTFYQTLPAKPDLVVCVFGYLGDNETAFKNFEEAHRIIDVNYTGAVSILNIAAADMIERNTGSIVGISSVAGERGRQSNFHYGSAKAGFTAYLSGLRNYCFAHGVHVLTVKPGFVKTKMTRDLPLNPKLTALPKKIAEDVFRAESKKRNTLYSLWMWKYIMLIINMIPENIFKKLKL